MMSSSFSLFAVFLFVILSFFSSISCSNSSSTSSSLLSSPPSSSSSDSPHHHLYILSIPAPGHVNPLLSIGADLAERGWRVSVLSESSMVHHIKRQWSDLTNHLSSPPQFSLIDIGRCSVVDEFFPLVAHACERNDFGEDLQEIFSWTMRIHPCMYQSSINAMEKIINKGEKGSKPSLFLIDFISNFGIDVANYYNTSFILNNADMISMISPATLPPFDFAPNLLPVSISSFLSSSSYYGLSYRLIYPLLRALIYVIIKFRHEITLQNYRQQSALGEQIDLWNILKGKIILMNTVSGLEYQRPLPPSIQMIGLPMPTNIPSKTVLQNNLDSYISQWIQQHPTKKFVFVSFGTLARPSIELIRSLTRTFTQPNLPFLVLWKLNSTSHSVVKEWMNDHQLISSDGPKGSFQINNLLITNWVSSQWSVLASDKIGAFISHCGINSAHESLWFGVPLLCIPMFGDQPDMAQRVVDAGAGLTITKIDAAADNQLNPSLTEQYLTSLITDSSYSIAAGRMASLLKLSGGASRAADIMEHVAQFGVHDFLTVQEQVPWYVALSVDVYAIYTTFILFSLISTYYCGRFLRTLLQPVLCWISRKANKKQKMH